MSNGNGNGNGNWWKAKEVYGPNSQRPCRVFGTSTQATIHALRRSRATGKTYVTGDHVPQTNGSGMHHERLSYYKGRPRMERAIIKLNGSTNEGR